jgi:hypothetical protein
MTNGEETSVGVGLEGRDNLEREQRQQLMANKLRIAFGTTVDAKEPSIEGTLRVFYRSIFDTDGVKTRGIDENDGKYSDRIAVLGEPLYGLQTGTEMGVEDFVKATSEIVLGMDLREIVISGAGELVDQLRKSGCEWGVWTGGDPEWQKIKMKNCGLFAEGEPTSWIYKIKRGSFGMDMNLEGYRKVAVVEDVPKFIDEAYEKLGEKGLLFRVAVGRHGVGEDRKECKTEANPMEVTDLNQVMQRLAEENMGMRDLVVLDFDGTLINDNSFWQKAAQKIESEMIGNGWIK